MPGHVVHHKSKQQRAKQPHPITEHPKFKKIVDKLIYIVAVIGPASMLPQIIKIWVHKSGGDISIFTFVMFVVINIIWLTYGILHKEKPLIIAYSMWMIANISVALGAIIYQ